MNNILTKRLAENLSEIKEMVNLGYNPNTIYEKIGGRKTDLLKLVRDLQAEKPSLGRRPIVKRDPEKYIPRKYRGEKQYINIYVKDKRGGGWC